MPKERGLPFGLAHMDQATHPREGGSLRMMSGVAGASIGPFMRRLQNPSPKRPREFASVQFFMVLEAPGSMTWKRVRSEGLFSQRPSGLDLPSFGPLVNIVSSDAPDRGRSENIH